MRSLLKSPAALLLSSLWLLSASPACCEPTGIFKNSCEAIFQSIQAHYWERDDDCSGNFPYVKIFRYHKSNATAVAYKLGNDIPKIVISLPRTLVESDWKMICHTLGLPESTPAPNFESVSDRKLINSDGKNWVTIYSRSGIFWLEIGSKDFYQTGEDFMQDKVKPQIVKDKAREMVEDLLPR